MLSILRTINNFITYLFASIFLLIASLFSTVAMGFVYIGEKLLGVEGDE